MLKNIKPINDRGYVLVAGLENVPAIAKFKSFEVITNSEKNITINLLDDETGNKVGAMTQKGYFQLGEVFTAGRDVLNIEFPSVNQIAFRVATSEEIDVSNKSATEKKAAKKVGGKKAEKTSTIDALLADGTIKQVEGKAGRFEYSNPVEVTENDKVTCLRKSGLFTVKSIDKTKGVITAIDNNSQNHYFGIKEVAVAN